MKSWFLFLTAGLIFNSCNNHPSESEDSKTDTTAVSEPSGENNLAYKWGKLALAATANDTERFRPRPTVTSRYLALTFIAIFDAWSAYDENAIPVYMLGVEKRPSDEQTLSNKEIAISYAAFYALNEFFYSDSLMFDQFMDSLGFDSELLSDDLSTPEGIGYKAAHDVIEARKNDGSNQYGEHPGAPTPFGDYTHYQPVNTPDKHVTLGRWQPKYFADGNGGKFAPSCLTPYWGNVKPISLDSSSQFRSPAPPALGSDQLLKELQEVIDLQANLTLEQKALVEFMRDGPKSVQQTGHWLIFAQDVSRRDNHTLDQDVKMYFLVTMAAMDAFIACWETKMYYDYARPYTLIHHYYKGKDIQAWGGPNQGTITMKGENWIPYSPETFVCPPFPSYISGHSTVSGACSKVLELYTGSDHFGESIRLLPGAMTEPGITNDSITLELTTFSETANMAGRSRVLGGYHIECENQEALAMGRKIGQKVWEKYLYHIGSGLN
ncbi:MAG: vanadium-dependent haloperoxidase [Crocinitomicaceae bacterium]|nr:vanadium-dependent haloperoxidase [Crocinitomicaceae bacterium]